MKDKGLAMEKHTPRVFQTERQQNAKTETIGYMTLCVFKNP